MWVVVDQTGIDRVQVFGVFKDPDVAREWALDNGYKGAWMCYVTHPGNIDEVHLVRP